MRYAAIQRVLGAIVGLSSLFALPPLLLALLWNEHDAAQAFGESLLVAGAIGLLMWWPVRRVNYELRLRDGFFVTTASWVVAGLVCALPFMLTAPHLSYADAVFEAVSGLTTTGATVIIGIEHLPDSLKLYRASLNFWGGMGIVILAIAILPMLRIGGMQLFRAEATGPTKDRLTPRIAETAKALWRVYLGLGLLCCLAFWVGGMSFFDAICHAMATVATGGFGNYDASFGHWDSAELDWIASVFMLLGGVNFGLHFLAWKRATMGVYRGDSELRAFLRITAVVAAVIALTLWWNDVFDSPMDVIRHATFQTISSITTTGFTTTGFSHWPGFTALVLVLISFVGGCSGSTAGGMKVTRVVMVVRQGLREVSQLVHPKGQFLVKMGGRRISESVVLSVSGFCSLYVLSFVLLTLVLTATGLDPTSAFSAVVACMNNLGPGLGAVAAHFQDVSDIGIWTCSFAMILGRLEVFTVFVLLTPRFWRE